jgi:gamma-glutamylcyclotransferase
MRYFSYGSNMSLRRLKAPERVPSAKKLCVAKLPEHRLMFHKKSSDGSAKCDAYYTGNRKDFVLGVLFEVDQSEKEQLDRVEGLGSGYQEKEVTLLTDSGEQNAVVYYATDIDPNLKPYSWYKHHVLVGASENNLPAKYVAGIEGVDSVVDQDRTRESKELNIFR